MNVPILWQYAKRLGIIKDPTTVEISPNESKTPWMTIALFSGIAIGIVIGVPIAVFYH